MKKFFLSIIFALLLGTTFSQETSVGIKGGVNFSEFDGPGNRSIVGINGGIFGNVDLGKITLQPEILYSQQGAVRGDTFLDPNGKPIATVDVTTALSYLNVPFLIKFKLLDRFCLFTGPQVGFILDAKVKYDPSINTPPDIKRNVNTDISAALGFSYEFQSRLIMDARYNLGLSNVTSYNSDKNRVIQISIAYKLFSFGM